MSSLSNVFNLVARKLASGLVVLFLSVGNLSAQSRTSIELSGRVMDYIGAVIAGANVIARGADGRTVSTVTDEKGNYRLEIKCEPNAGSKIPQAALYEISAERLKSGFARTVFKEFKVAPAYTGRLRLDIVLDVIDPEPCGYAGSDCMIGEPIAPDTSEPGRKISPRQIDKKTSTKTKNKNPNIRKQ